jgi:hypothetical protein
MKIISLKNACVSKVALCLHVETAAQVTIAPYLLGYIFELYSVHAESSNEGTVLLDHYTAE